jgi:hypothetical protein
MLFLLFQFQLTKQHRGLAFCMIRCRFSMQRHSTAAARSTCGHTCLLV